MKLVYRRLELGDEHVLGMLSRSSRRFGSDGEARPYEPLAESEAAAFLREPRNYIDVAFDGERPIGMLLAYELQRRHGPPKMLFIYELGVDVDYRRRGIGRTLLRRAAERASECGISRAFLITDERNTAALALYRGEGAIREQDDDVVLEFDFAERT
jgi:ribosomal protein S18 acetylase RimI-like enzyme